MASGIKRNLHVSLFSSDEYHNLTAAQAILFVNLVCHETTPRTGIIKISYHRLKDFSKGELDRSSIGKTLELFERNGWIKRDGKYLWIINFIRIQGNSQNWVDGALKDVRDLIQHTPLAEECLEYYLTDGIETASGRRPNGIETASRPQMSEVRSQESVNTSLFAADAPAPPPAKAKRKPKPPSYSEEDLFLATELGQIILSLEADGLQITSPRTPQTIAAGIAKCSLTHQQIRKMFLWARFDPYQRAGLVKMVRWTTKAAYADLWNKYQQNRDIRSAENGDEPAAPVTAVAYSPPEHRPPATNEVANRIYDELQDKPDGMSRVDLEVALVLNALSDILGMMVREKYIASNGDSYYR